MEKSALVLLALMGVALGGSIHGGPPPQLVQPVGQGAAVAVGPAHVNEPQYHSAPQQYAHEVPAAAIRNVETVDVTKTITPVVTKTTTHRTHSEPALSVGHVQGYSQAAHGQAKFAPVQYNTQYTQYLNPTVGVNGPVTYSGPAVGQAVAVHEGIAAVPAQPVAVQPAPVVQEVVGGPAPGPVPVGPAPEPVAFAHQAYYNQPQPPVAVAHPAPVAYHHGVPAPYNFQPQPVAVAAPPVAKFQAPLGYHNFGGRIINSSPLLGYNNFQPTQFVNNYPNQLGPQLLNSGSNFVQHIPADAPNRAYASLPYAAGPAAGPIGITAFDSASLLHSAGYDSAHHNFQTVI